MIDRIASMDLNTLLLLGAGLLFVILMAIAQKKDDKFDMRDLIVDECGKVSLMKTGQLVALIVSTWALVHEVRVNRLSEWLFFGYMMAWAGANVAAKYIAMRQPTKDGQ